MTPFSSTNTAVFCRYSNSSKLLLWTRVPRKRDRPVVRGAIGSDKFALLLLNCPQVLWTLLRCDANHPLYVPRAFKCPYMFLRLYGEKFKNNPLYGHLSALGKAKRRTCPGVGLLRKNQDWLICYSLEWLSPLIDVYTKQNLISCHIHALPWFCLLWPRSGFIWSNWPDPNLNSRRRSEIKNRLLQPQIAFIGIVLSNVRPSRTSTRKEVPAEISHKYIRFIPSRKCFKMRPIRS